MTAVKPCPWHARILARTCRSLPHLGAKARKRLARDLARACPDCQDATSPVCAWTPTPHLPRDPHQEAA